MLSYSQFLITMLLCFLSLTAGVYVLYRLNNLFKSFIPNEWLRMNIVLLLMFECFMCAIIPIFHDFQYMASKNGLAYTFLFFCFYVMLNVTPTVITILALKQSAFYKKQSFALQQAMIFMLIIIIPGIATLSLNYYNNHLSTKYFKWAIIYSVFSASLAGLGYLFYTYAHYEKQQLLQARQLDYSRLNELKTKAELEALHSKINPHFLYNALNSIADLTITNGKKAREMTIALSELFRYTINYANSNFSTVREEIQMAETYLQIEKIRFEENLHYKVDVTVEALDILLPRFILQPLIENAVKHGIAGLNQKGEIKIEISRNNDKLFVKVFDNGKPFSSELNAGYGLKNIIDKLKILYPEGHQFEFINSPEKHLLLVLNITPSHDA